MGIAADQLERVFQPFEQMSYPTREIEGTGLGLPISKQIVEFMGGVIQVQSEVGRGSTFWFEVSLPVLETLSSPPSPNEGYIAGYKGALRHILVVDDKADNRVMLRMLLTQLGFQVTLAEGGAEAIKQAQLVKPDLILMDLVMPMINGFEAMERLRVDPEFAKLPIVAVSASVLDRSNQVSHVSGFDDFLSKPIQLVDVLNCLEKVLGLTWKYEVARTVVAAPPIVLIPPSRKQLEILHELVMFGDMSQVQAWADKLEMEDVTLTAFAVQVRQYAANYEDELLLTLVNQTLAREK
jgi:CheY-like chemotaxis protein